DRCSSCQGDSIGSRGIGGSIPGRTRCPAWSAGTPLCAAGRTRLAAMTSSILSFQQRILVAVGANVSPLPLLEHDLVSTGQDFERSPHLVQVVEARRAGLPEIFEVR